MKTILYIHGAFSTPLTFTHIKNNLPDHEAEFLTYDVSDTLQFVIDKEVERLKKRREHVSIIAHSLGGVLGSLIAQKTKLVDRVVTMSTPFGGNKAADLIKWFNPHPMFETISTTGPLTSSLRMSDMACPTLSLVTTKGNNPMFSEANDSAVTIKSQIAWDGPEYIELPYNHFEVLFADQPIKLIKEFLFDV
jgi:pimeloyl-ACP methyl ester carboxylesterase